MSRPPVGGALPLQWADPSEVPVVEETDSSGGEEAETDGAPDDPDEIPVVEMGETIDLTGRAYRTRGDDLDVWSDVLRRRPAEAARLTGHPSAAGERIAATAQPAAVHRSRIRPGRTCPPVPTTRSEPQPTPTPATTGPAAPRRRPAM